MGARMEEFEADTVIIKEDNPSSKMYIVLEGKVILYRNYGKDNEYIIGACNKGKTFGEMNILTNFPSLYTAVAFTNVKLAWFEKSNLDSFIKGYPDNALQLLESIAKSYVLLGKNLEMAIDEIDSLRTKLEKTGEAANPDFIESADIVTDKFSDFDIDEIHAKIAKAIGEFPSNWK